MTTLAEIVRDGKGRAGSNGSWRVYATTEGITTVWELWHYSTLMLKWEYVCVHVPGDPTPLQTEHRVVYKSIGHGTVSDQHGMNTAFRVLGLPYRMDCDWKGGGPRITELCQCSDFGILYPHHPSLCDPEAIDKRRIMADRRRHRDQVRKLHAIKPVLNKIIEKTSP